MEIQFLKMNKILVFIVFFLVTGINVIAQNVQYISSDNENISVEGSNYISFKNGELIAHRHNYKVYRNTTKENLFNPLKAKTCSGITLNFKTKSPTIKVKFRIIEGLKRAPVFGVFQDGEFDTNEQFKYKENDIISININSKNPNEEVFYTITYPLKTDVHFVGLELENNYKLEEYTKKTKKKYIAFGDSITHGTGQQTTQQTYSYILAKKLGYELFNTAVGGSKTSQVMAEMIRDDFKDIDMMTILVGVNDFNGEGVDVETLRNRYKNVLSTIRETHKDTKIYCIVSLASTWNKSKKTNLPIEPFITAIIKVVKERQDNGDKNIVIIEGAKLTTIKDLKDKVHLSIEGAKSFAEKLSIIIE